MAELNINERESGGVTILDLSGKITIGEGSVTLRDAIKKQVAAGKTNILLNLGEVSYMDSSGIGELVSSYTSVKNAGGKLKLLNLTSKIKELLVITKLLTVFDSFEDEGEALSSY